MVPSIIGASLNKTGVVAVAAMFMALSPPCVISGHLQMTSAG
jgi:hypothetical protein